MINKTKTILLTSAASILLSGCSHYLDSFKSLGKEPAMEKVEAPMERDNYEPIFWPKDTTANNTKQPRYANSLWRPGARTFFADRRARRVGDILKIQVNLKDKAKLKNKTTQERTATETSTAPKALGLETLNFGFTPGKFNPWSALAVNGTTNNEGTGSIEREEEIQTTVAAMVTQILPNGNLVIHGSQEFRVNYELRQVVVEGIVQPEDIGADNSIDSTQIAEARISYGGKGVLSRIQRPRIGSQIIEIISPF
ncbi:flagellar basal body L-ring protein FlgH [Rickettsiales bacterium]|nr:flagellar basal body L-ring protein FlgH [Rickettsiales bacterium]